MSCHVRVSHLHDELLYATLAAALLAMLIITLVIMLLVTGVAQLQETVSEMTIDDKVSVHYAFSFIHPVQLLLHN